MVIVASLPFVALWTEPVTLVLESVSQGVDYAKDGAVGW